MTSALASLRFLARFFRLSSEGFGEDLAKRGAAPGVTDDDRHEPLVRRILSTIHNNSILLCGTAGSGKTSLLLHLKERLGASNDSATDSYPVYIDLHGVPEERLFATVAEAVRQQLSPMPILNAAKRTAGPTASYSHRDLAQDLRNVLRALKTSGSGHARLVLLVDGIDELNHYAPRTAQRVRSLFMASLDGNLSMVATAIEIDRQWEEEGSPWYNFFEEIEVRADDE